VKSFYFLIFLGISLSLTACGGRLPSPETSQKVITKYFEKYGKKYRDSDFGRHRVERVEIEGIEEIQRKLASVKAFTYLSDEGPVYRVRFTFGKKSFRWRPQAWENLGKR